MALVKAPKVALNKSPVPITPRMRVAFGFPSVLSSALFVNPIGGGGQISSGFMIFWLPMTNRRWCSNLIGCSAALMRHDTGRRECFPRVLPACLSVGSTKPCLFPAWSGGILGTAGGLLAGLAGRGRGACGGISGGLFVGARAEVRGRF